MGLEKPQTLALHELIDAGPSWSYRQTDAPNHFAPDPDPREFPDLSCRLVRPNR